MVSTTREQSDERMLPSYRFLLIQDRTPTREWHLGSVNTLTITPAGVPRDLHLGDSDTLAVSSIISSLPPNLKDTLCY